VKRGIAVPASLFVALDVSPVHPLPFGETNPDPEDAKRSVTLDQPRTPGSVSFRAKAIDAKGTNATPDADQRLPHHEVNGKSSRLAATLWGICDH
jgi:hypothetical protein